MELKRCFDDWKDMIMHDGWWDKNYSVQSSMVKNGKLRPAVEKDDVGVLVP